MVKIESLLPMNDKFIYLEAILKENGGFKLDKASRICTVHAKWKQASGILCDVECHLDEKSIFITQ